MGLRGYLLKRSINTVILIFFVLSLNFIIFIGLPGSQASIEALFMNPNLLDFELRDKLIAEQEIRFGIRCSAPGEPRVECDILTKYTRYLASMLTFQFGMSQQNPSESVVYGMVSSGRLVNTLMLLGVANVVALVIGVFIGVLTARKRGTSFDNGWVTTSLTTYSLPTFWMGLMLILVFALWLRWFPAGGVTPQQWVDPALRPASFLAEIPVRLQYLFLPALTLTLFFYGGYLLLTRATMLEALSEDYITTARAKGLSERTVLYKHALKNASLPLVTSAALQFGFLLSGAIITETVFNWDGLGKWLFDAISWKDGPVMQAMFYIIALCVILANFASDIIYGLLDPRIKYE